MKFMSLIIISLFALSISAIRFAPKCSKNQIYLAKGPGPFCYPTCCGPRGPACRIDSFTSGCFCASDLFIKKYPVANNTIFEKNNPCIPVNQCNSATCVDPIVTCTKPHEEYRQCGPTSMCDNQVCRGMQPFCPEEEAAICVAGCFCKAGYSRMGADCIKQCPLLP